MIIRSSLEKCGTILAIFAPSLLGFVFGFHVFLKGHENFSDFYRASMKVLIMMLGEYDYADNFSYTKVDEVGGMNLSVQVNKKLT